MNSIFNIKVNDTFDFKIENEELSSLDILQVSDSEFHILQHNKSYKAEIQTADFNNKTYKVKVNNNTYNININNQLDLLIKDLGFSISSTKHVNSIKAPMPGLILDINIKVGQKIKENDTLLILEAMKMENIISSPRNGVIKCISANIGDAVEKNQLLIEFE